MSEEEVVETVEETTEETSSEENTSFVESMLNSIDDADVKAAGFWKNLDGKDATEVGRYMKELHGFAGKKGDIPKEDAPAEEWQEFYNKLGRPDSVEGYDFSLNDEFKELAGDESNEYFDGLINSMKESFYTEGLTSKQAEAVLSNYLNFTSANLKDRNESLAEFETENEAVLDKEWGDKRRLIENSINVMLKANGVSDEDLSIMLDAGLLSDPSLAIPLAKIASKFADDPEIGHAHTSTQAGLRDQLYDYQTQIQGYIAKGDNVPPHIFEKFQSIRQRLGEDL